jgi:hypothetical protein
MKIEWVEDKFADLGGEDGVFNRAADPANRHQKAAPNAGPSNSNQPKKLVPMLRTCHGDLVKAPYCALGR